MLDGAAAARKSPLRNPKLYLAVLAAAALSYEGWVFYSRWEQNRASERRAAEKKLEEDRRTVEAMGGTKLVIQSFYASPGIVKRGEAAQICYGVANAKAVRIEPPVSQPAWPSYARCVNVTLAKTTTYTLTAEDGRGHTATASLTIQVR